MGAVMVSAIEGKARQVEFSDDSDLEVEDAQNIGSQDSLENIGDA